MSDSKLSGQTVENIINGFYNKKFIDINKVNEKDRFLFQSQLIECNAKVSDYKKLDLSADDDEVDTEYLQKLYDLAKKCGEPDKMKYLKHGDIIRFFDEGYRNNKKFIYNSIYDCLEELDWSYGNGYGYVPENYKINNFPTIEYFSNSIDLGTPEVCMDFNDVIEIESFVYKTSDNIIIINENKVKDIAEDRVCPFNECMHDKKIKEKYKDNRIVFV
jgi:hypothetical protein